MSDQPEAGPRIVVGIDGSDRSGRALARAAVEAEAHGAELDVVYAWNYLDQQGRDFDPNYGEDQARERMQAFIAATLGDEPSVPVQLRLINDHPSPALVAAAEGAFTLVVGARGIGGFKGLMLGSVSRYVVSHSPVAALIVH